MSESPKSTTSAENPSISRMFANLVSYSLIGLGLILLAGGAFGGALLAISGLLALSKIRNYLTGISPHASHRNLKIASIVVLIIGFVTTSDYVNTENAEEWKRNKEQIIVKLNEDFKSNRADEVEKTIRKYSKAAVGDPQFEKIASAFKSEQERIVEDEKKAAALKLEAKNSAEVTTSSKSRYLGSRLLELAQADPKVSPMPTSLEQELKECKFEKDEESNLSVAKNCAINEVAPTYNKRPGETLEISADTPHCCLNEVTVHSNQWTGEKTIDLFDGIAGVKKIPAACPNVEPVFGRSEFFTITKNGVKKFAIQENTDGGSGGNNTSTTIYYGMPDIDCTRIADSEKMKLDSIREANLKHNSTKSSNQGEGEPLVGVFACNYNLLVQIPTGKSKEMMPNETATFRLQGKSGIFISSTNLSREIRLNKINQGPAGTMYIYTPVTQDAIITEYMISPERGADIKGVLSFKNASIGEFMALGSCKKIQ